MRRAIFGLCKAVAVAAAIYAVGCVAFAKEAAR